MIKVIKRQALWQLGMLSLLLMLLVGCDPSWSLRFAHGKVRPNARINIELPAPRTLAELYPKYIEVASRGGYPYTRSYPGVRSLEELLSEDFGGAISALRWAEYPDVQSSYQRQVIFLSGFSAREEPVRSKRTTSSITFMFQRENGESFTKEEWLEFFVFYEEILPDVFPKAEIQISKTRHPAVFTDDEVLRQIQQETDIEIPEKYWPDGDTESEKEQ